jgi:hypothetical protein
MQIPVLIEPIAGKGFRARGGEPLVLTAEGPTREAALANLKEKLRDRLRNGAEILSLELNSEAHPLDEFIGMYQEDDPMIRQWEKDMARYRRQVDRKRNIP